MASAAERMVLTAAVSEMQLCQPGHRVVELKYVGIVIHQVDCPNQQFVADVSLLLKWSGRSLPPGKLLHPKSIWLPSIIFSNALDTPCTRKCNLCSYVGSCFT